MKRTIKKLNLRKEALLNLSRNHLDRAGGGASPHDAVAFESGKICPVADAATLTG
jgi:hypothetical protein